MGYNVNREPGQDVVILQVSRHQLSDVTGHKKFKLFILIAKGWGKERNPQNIPYAAHVLQPKTSGNTPAAEHSWVSSLTATIENRHVWKHGAFH